MGTRLVCSGSGGEYAAVKASTGPRVADSANHEGLSALGTCLIGLAAVTDPAGASL